MPVLLRKKGIFIDFLLFIFTLEEKHFRLL